MNTPIKLGKKMSDAMPCCGADSMSGEHYPSVYLSGKEFEDMPKSGTMTVRFKRRSLNTSEREDKTDVDVSVDLVEVMSVDSDAPEVEEAEDTATVLDRLRKELLEEKDEE